MIDPDDVAGLAQGNPFNPWLGGLTQLEPETARAIIAMLPSNLLYFSDLAFVPAEFTA